MNAIIEHMIFKHAYIDKIEVSKRYQYDEREYDYVLVLNEKQFKDFRERGLPAKQSETIHGDHKYWIRVRPHFRDSNGRANFELTDEMEKKFLRRNDIEILFDVYIGYVCEHVVVCLYFTLDNVRELD